LTRYNHFFKEYEEITMKRIRLYTVLIIALLSLASVLVMAQEETEEPINALPLSMETALVPCGEGVTGACDMIATSAEDIVGVWKQYLGNPRFNAPNGMAYIRFNIDGTYVIADTIDHTAQAYEAYPSGTFRFDEGEYIVNPAAGAPPPCDQAAHYQLRVLKYGDQPVALRFVPINELCPGRLQDHLQASVWVAP
jgi:hypothetical protein